MLLSLLLVVRAPGGVGALGAVAGTPPVPLAIVTQEDIHAQIFLNPELDFVHPARSCSTHASIIKL